MVNSTVTTGVEPNTTDTSTVPPMMYVNDEGLDNNYEDILRTSNIQTNFSISNGNRNIAGKPTLPLSWIVPDGTNRTLEEIWDRKVSSGTPGGGQSGAIVMKLQRLEPYY